MNPGVTVYRLFRTRGDFCHTTCIHAKVKVSNNNNWKLSIVSIKEYEYVKRL
jgi:hypothetical protein